MRFFSQAWVQIKAFLAKLSYAERALLAMLVAVPLLAAAVVLNFAASPDMAPLAHPPDRLPAVEARLQAVGIKYAVRSGQLVVPVNQREEAFLALTQAGLLAQDTSAQLDKIIGDANPWTSPRQREDAILQAKNRFLSAVIAKMVGIRSADVLADLPRSDGFGPTHKKPSAMVNVLTDGERTLNRKMVEAIASLVSHSFSGMSPGDVVVIDAGRGLSFTVKDADGGDAGEADEAVRALEARYRDKLAELLSYIPGVRVAVNVEADTVLAKGTEKIDYAEIEPLKSTSTRTMERTTTSDGGEPGTRSNTGMSIDAGGGTRTTERTDDTREEFGDKPIVQKTTLRERGQGAKQVSVTVNVPRGYFVGLFKLANPDAKDEPNEAALEPFKTEQLAKIESQVELQISTTESKGMVKAHMVPDFGNFFGPGAPGLPGPTPVLASGSDYVATALGSDWAKPAALGALAVGAMALMMYVARKGHHPQRMPSVEELAGVPPSLPVDDDLVGEADAVESAMAGVELGENEIRSRKIAEQIGEMVKGNPTEAASLFSRWIRKED